MLNWLGSVSAGLDSMTIDHRALTLGDGHAVVLDTLSPTKGDRSFSGNRAVVYHVGDDKISVSCAVVLSASVPAAGLVTIGSTRPERAG